jgi:hypothetical protein
MRVKDPMRSASGNVTGYWLMLEVGKVERIDVLG